MSSIGSCITAFNQAISLLQQKVSDASQEIEPPSSKEAFEKHIQRSAGQIHARIRRWKQSVDELQKAEFLRFKEMFDERNKVFHTEMNPLVERISRKELDLKEAVEIAVKFKSRLDDENENLFPPYIRALESLQESIDLEYLASSGSEEISELESEVERLNGLAQLESLLKSLGTNWRLTTTLLDRESVGCRIAFARHQQSKTFNWDTMG